MSADVDGAFEATLDAAFLAERLGRWFGVYPALVRDVRDKDGQGRVKVALPWSPDAGGAAYEAWARVATLMAGNGRGTWFVPEVGDEVLVCFEAGDPRRPYVLGGLWNGVDRAPETMDEGGRNDVRTIRSRSGHQIRLDDTAGRETVTVSTRSGQGITLRETPPSVEITDASGNSVKMEPAGITLDSAARVTITAGTVEISTATLTVSAGMSTYSGVVKADTAITNTVVSATYTPGAGNIW
jgi:uncharacterized protein involved in type VI secretion and phage assembly